MIKLIIFDWDDVITLGAKEAYFTCYHHAITSVGVRLSPEEERKRILTKWSKPARIELEELLKEHPELVDDALAVYQGHKQKIFVNTLTMPMGTIQTLQALGKRYVLAVATGNTTDMIKDTIMPHFRIPPVFSRIVSTHDVHDIRKTKPHPYMLQHIIKHEGVTPSETLYVGDAATDVAMAHRAGVTPVVVLTGHLSRKEAMELGVKWIIPDITHVPVLLERIEKGGERMYFVYILQCRGGGLYTGITKDVEKRFDEHISGKGGAYTRSHKPIRIVYTERKRTKSAALKREAEIKRWSKATKILTFRLKI